MKKLASAVLSLCLLLALLPDARAAVQGDLVFDKDTLFKPSGSFLAYKSVTVRASVTVTVDKSVGFEIMDSLTVEPGGKFICNGEGNVAFHFCMKNRGSTVTGVELYYPQRWDDGHVTYERIPEPFADTWTNSEAWSELSPQFKWNDACGGWCLTWSIGGNPFNIRFYHTPRDMETAERAAQRLHELGVFNGVGTKAGGTPDYDLARGATRMEGLVMLVRLLGKEQEALSGTWSHPFSDVPAWAEQYAGYAWETGLTKGKGDGTFGASDAITAQAYLTFLLRALGCAEDGLYENALALADEAGLLAETPELPYEVCLRDFYRADMAVASLRALERQAAQKE